MARRRKKQDSLAEIISSGALLAFFLLWGIFKSFIVAVIIAGCILGLGISIRIMQNMKHAEKLRNSGIHEVDKMDGIQFEEFLKHVFVKQGYIVEVTRAAGDFGADLILTKSGEKIVVQAKRYSKNVGIEAVQQVYSAMNHYSATESWVITNSNFTNAAKELAKSNQVRLINRSELIELVLQMNPDAVSPIAKQVIQSIPQERRVCDRCGSSMVLEKRT